jgi:hypothetical protein
MSGENRRVSGELAYKSFGLLAYVRYEPLVVSKVGEGRSLGIPCDFPDGPEQRVEKAEDICNVANQRPAEQGGDLRVAIHALVSEKLVADRLINRLEFIVMRRERGL